MEETTALLICQFYRAVILWPVEFIHAFSHAQLIFRAVIYQSVLREESDIDRRLLPGSLVPGLECPTSIMSFCRRSAIPIRLPSSSTMPIDQIVHFGSDWLDTVKGHFRVKGCQIWVSEFGHRLSIKISSDSIS